MLRGRRCVLASEEGEGEGPVDRCCETCCETCCGVETVGRLIEAASGAAREEVHCLFEGGEELVLPMVVGEKARVMSARKES